MTAVSTSIGCIRPQLASASLPLSSEDGSAFLQHLDVTTWVNIRGCILDMDEWPGALAVEFAPHEVPIAKEIVRRYSMGGKSRERLSVDRGEQTGGFGGGIPSGEFVQVLDSLVQCAQAILAVLQHPAVGNAAGLGGLLLSLIQLRQRRRPGSGPGPGSERDRDRDAVRVEIHLSSAIVELADRALEQTCEQMLSQGYRQDVAWDRACRLLGLVVVEPDSAADFIRSLDGKKEREGTPQRLLRLVRRNPLRKRPG